MGCIQTKPAAIKTPTKRLNINTKLSLKPIPQQTPSQIQSSPEPQKLQQLNPQESQFNRKSVSQPVLLSGPIYKVEKRTKVTRINQRAINFRRQTNESALSNETGCEETNGNLQVIWRDGLEKEDEVMNNDV